MSGEPVSGMGKRNLKPPTQSGGSSENERFALTGGIFEAPKPLILFQ